LKGIVGCDLFGRNTAIIKDFAVAIEKGVWPLNVHCVGRYNHGGI